ncbi:carboxylesterase/lipase family protein [Paraburkholderia elongata]|uniref:Carboxylic ester hydrolase n=1 Tax=Paraburkholderia elongata TaxID=2675747 RepID=A0A972NXS0_9BURK|nr:carboxylesterase family protein [Paraburkholderia elongata]NPT60862.1 carboxylesterase family protein [Paraburkholderia elongata]
MNEIVTVSQGQLKGEPSVDGEVTAFRGIPFASPPIGDLRWRAPRPPAAWTGLRDATRAKPIAIQQSMLGNSLLPFGDEHQSEDCLYLNVWTAATDAGERRPVIVWIHPGGFQFGSGSAPFFDGDAWARDGVVFVTINYRLAKLGFLAHPQLSVESDEGISGNYGLLDQIAALQWVRDNIAEFGGDPGCVTIFGISAGASSVSLLMASPRARGLFHRAIAESGGSFGTVAEDSGVADRWQTLAAATRSGKAWADGIAGGAKLDIRTLDVDTIRTASSVDGTNMQGIFDAAQPIVDGAVLPAGSYQIFESRQQAAVPLLVGSVANEDLVIGFSPNLTAYRAYVQAEYGDSAERFLALYPAATDAEAIAASLKANSHRVFTWQNWTWAHLHAAAGHDVYYYQFQKAPPVPADSYDEQAFPRPLGAFHCSSIFFSFDRFSLRNWPWQPGDYVLGKTIRAAWVEFARTGRPAAKGLPDWPAFDPAAPRVMALNDEIGLTHVPWLEHLHYWDAHYGARRAATYATG